MSTEGGYYSVNGEITDAGRPTLHDAMGAGYTAGRPSMEGGLTDG